MEADKKWYVIHTYSGYENKVQQRIKKLGKESIKHRNNQSDEYGH